MTLKTFCFIFARGGSKGIHKKNIKNLLGQPLIAYSINLAKEISEIKKIFVSTDDNEIAEIASSYGANIIKRPLAISKDDSSEWLAWVHAIEWVYKEYGYLHKSQQRLSRGYFHTCLMFFSCLRKNTYVFLRKYFFDTTTLGFA